MIRLFDTHKIRQTKGLDGMWDFEKEDGCKYNLPVPACWEQHPELLTYRGIGIYRKKIELDSMSNIRLEFKGVSHTADIFFDGKMVGHHYNAYTPFEVILKGVEAGEHELQVRVDNRFTDQSALHIPNDYYTYGGITRPVSLEVIPDVFIQWVHVTPSLYNEIWSAKIEVSIRNIASVEHQITIQGVLAGQILEGNQVTITSDEEQIISWTEQFLDVNPWTPETPTLYTVAIQVLQNGTPIDDLMDRVGFRVVHSRNKKLYLNDNPILLKGFNRHEDYGTIGCAIPLNLMAQDLDLLQDMGANAVRTCHYPNDERFLDLCDERGILVWEENHARGLSLERMQNAKFESQCEDCIREMITAHYNHPSIVIWGILNECASDTMEGRNMYKKQYDQIRTLDKTRPTTSATCRHFSDVCLDLPDIVSFNIYGGWYESGSIKERHEKEMTWIQEKVGTETPIIVSEFGAGAIYGYRDRSHAKWSEERQADIIRENLRVYREDSRLTGIFLWQFADCRVTEEENWALSRPRSHNNKGILDEYRRPKLAYDVVKEFYENWK